MDANLTCPPDILNFLDTCGLSHRKAAFQKNVPAAFASGLVVAEIIAATYPKLIQIHSYSDASNAQGRISNWELLDKKLKLFNCELSEKQHNQIANRTFSTEEICNFLRKLQIRMPSYEPVYLAKQIERNTTQQQQQQQKTRLNGEAGTSPNKKTMNKSANVQQQQTVKKRFGTSTAGTSTSGLNINKSTGPAQNLSKAKTNRIMDSIWERQERVKKIAELTDDDIERMYHQFSQMYKTESDNNNAQAEKMNIRSRQIDCHFAELREANLRDMDRTARRLTLLQSKPQMRDSLLGFEMDPLLMLQDENEVQRMGQNNSNVNNDVDNDGDDDSYASESSDDSYGDDIDKTVKQQNKNKNKNKNKLLYSSGRAAALEHKILALMPEGHQQQQSQANICASSSSITDVTGKSKKPAVQISDLVSEEEVEEKEEGGERGIDDSDSNGEYGSDDDSDSGDEAPPPPPKPVAAAADAAVVSSSQKEAAAVAPTTVLSFANSQVIVPDAAPPRTEKVVDYKRVFDAHHQRHYYVALKSSISQWETPKDGIVECEDNQKNKFYTDCRTGRSGWTLDAL